MHKQVPPEYFPPAETAGGWRICDGPDRVRAAGMNSDRLEYIHSTALAFHPSPWAVAIIRGGQVTAEWYAVPTLPTTTFDIWSCTKAFTSLAFGMLLEDSRNGAAGLPRAFELDSPAYDFIPAAWPLSDARKTAITIRHLLSMTSGIPGEGHGIVGIAAGRAAGGGPFEIALGQATDRFGRSAAELFAEPGTAWEYGDVAFSHLSLVFREAAGIEMSDYLVERLFEPLGIDNFGWDHQGGAGYLGPHTNAHTGLRLTARDLARVGYLLLQQGAWAGEQIVPAAWVERMSRSSQDFNPEYGYGMGVNTRGHQWPSLPNDAYAMQGFASNRCYVVPSLDLVVVRLGYGPVAWDDQAFIGPIAAAVTG